MVLKGLLRLEMSILIPSSGYAASGAQAQAFFTTPAPWWKFWKKS
jgi:hypothetical protein